MRRSTHESRDRRPGRRALAPESVSGRPEEARWSSPQRSSARCVVRSSSRARPASPWGRTRGSGASCSTRTGPRSRRATTAARAAPHAEAAALAEAGADARGATAVVTLEPCNHTGRTGPCAEAMVEAGVARVVFAQPDPNPVAAGGEVDVARGGRRGRLRPDGARGAGAEPGLDLRHGAPPAVRHLEVRRDTRRPQRRCRRQQQVDHLPGCAGRRAPPAGAVRRDARRHRDGRGRRPAS